MPPQIYAFSYTFQILFYTHSLACQCHPAFHSPIFGAKEVSYTNDYGYTNYILAFRGTEPSNIGDIKADVNLTFKNLPKKQYFDMLLFYYQCIGKIPFYVDSTSMPQDKDSLEYKLWKKLYQRSIESKYKPYIIKSLLQDSTQNPTPSNFTPPITATTKLTITGHSLSLLLQDIL